MAHLFSKLAIASECRWWYYTHIAQASFVKSKAYMLQLLQGTIWWPKEKHFSMKQPLPGRPWWELFLGFLTKTFHDLPPHLAKCHMLTQKKRGDKLAVRMCPMSKGLPEDNREARFKEVFHHQQFDNIIRKNPNINDSIQKFLPLSRKKFEEYHTQFISYIFSF